MSRLSTSIVIGVCAGALFLATVFRAEAGASPRALATLPDDCSSGMLVVAQGSDRFACVEPSRALALSGCRDGDFVMMNAFGQLRCQGISTSSTTTTKALLPSCSSGQILVSEGSSGWRCADLKR